MVEQEQAATELPGARLVLARERLGLSVAQVAAKLRLDVRTVSALETGEYAKVGAAVFVRGFLRRYAELVGEPAPEIDALYTHQPDAAAVPDLSKTGLHRLDPAAQGRALGVGPASIAAAVLGVIAAVWWALRVGTTVHPAAEEGQAEVLHLSVPASALPATAPVAAPAGQVSAEGASAAAASDAGTDALLASLPHKSVQLTFSGECWAEVYDARGWRLFFGFGHAGLTQELSGVPPFRLVLGNVAAVAVAVEGTPVELPEAAPGARLRVSLKGNGTVASVR
ncbi:MAG TPA: RodZ domain-containing protein [Steroidobacteraceae bacterium]|nr:RodZ domain-containing protein [Steroidobacteraceae bacterium]